MRKITIGGTHLAGRRDLARSERGQRIRPWRLERRLDGGVSNGRGAAAVAEAYGQGFDLLLGRRTYDLWAGVWPTIKGGLFADNLNAATKYRPRPTGRRASHGVRSGTSGAT